MGLAPALRPQRVGAIYGASFHDRVSRNIRRISQSYRCGASIANALRSRYNNFRGVLKSFLRHSAPRRDRRFFFQIVEAEGIRRVLQGQVGNVIRNGAFTQILVVLIGGDLANRLKRARGAINVVRTVLFRDVCYEVRFATQAIGVDDVRVSTREFTACRLNVRADQVDRPIIHVSGVGFLLTHGRANGGEGIVSLVVGISQVTTNGLRAPRVVSIRV